MHHDTVIIGGGMGGVVAAAHLLAEGSPSVAIIDPGNLGASFQGGLRYLRDNPAMRALLDRWGVLHASETVKGGILSPKGRVLPYPEGVGEHLEDAQRLHYLKTRGTLDGYTGREMNFGGGGARLNCDLHRFIGKVASCPRFTHYRTNAVLVSGPMVSLGNRRWVEGKRIISTIPLPVLARLLQLEPHEAPTCPHRVLHVGSLPLHGGNAALGHFDYTYTPWLKAIHRVHPAPRKGTLEVEWNSAKGEEEPEEALSDDLGRIGWAGHTLDWRTLPGHLLPVEWGTWRPEAPLYLLGRFAQWDSRMTVDKVASTLADRSMS